MQVKTRNILWTLAGNTVCVRSQRNTYPNCRCISLIYGFCFRTYLWHLTHWAITHTKYVPTAAERVHLNVWNCMFFEDGFTFKHQLQIVIHTGSVFFFFFFLNDVDRNDRKIWHAPILKMERPYRQHRNCDDRGNANKILFQWNMFNTHSSVIFLLTNCWLTSQTAMWFLQPLEDIPVCGEKK